MTGITTHVLDTALGKPAAGVVVRLGKKEGEVWVALSESKTDADGRCRDLLNNATAGIYRLTFATGEYFRAMGRQSIYPEIAVTFTTSGEAHYHLPLLVTDNSYTTYRGS
jgi:5-hydroxyisourate hydrolase